MPSFKPNHEAMILVIIIANNPAVPAYGSVNVERNTIKENHTLSEKNTCV